KTERWVPVDSVVCELVERIRSLRPPAAPPSRSFAIASASRPLHVDSQAPRCTAGGRVRGRNSRPHRSAPISTHLWNGDDTSGRQLCCRYETPRSQEPGHDLGLYPHHSAASPARVPLGSLPSQTPGAIYAPLL